MSEANSEEETLAKTARYSHKSLMAGYDLYGVRGSRRLVMSKVNPNNRSLFK